MTQFTELLELDITFLATFFFCFLFFAAFIFLAFATASVFIFSFSFLIRLGALRVGNYLDPPVISQ